MNKGGRRPLADAPPLFHIACFDLLVFPSFLEFYMKTARGYELLRGMNLFACVYHVHCFLKMFMCIPFVAS